MTLNDRLTKGLHDAEDIESAILITVGAASMCWNPRPTGVFDDQAAKVIAECLRIEIERRGSK